MTFIRSMGGSRDSNLEIWKIQGHSKVIIRKKYIYQKIQRLSWIRGSLPISAGGVVVVVIDIIFIVVGFGAGVGIVDVVVVVIVVVVVEICGVWGSVCGVGGV